MNLAYSLRIHSCLSFCGDDNIIPANIVDMAALKGLEAITLIDHNTCRNCPASLAAAAEYGIPAVPGTEISASEEAHVACLFPSLKSALDFDAYVYTELVEFPNNETTFGE